MTEYQHLVVELFEERLKRELADLQALMLASGPDSAPVELDQQSVGRLARIDATQIQSIAMATKRRREHQLVRHQQALDRISQAGFWFCADCDEEIGVRRLNIDPTAYLCVSCADDGLTGRLRPR